MDRLGILQLQTRLETGTARIGTHDHVLRNHTVGSRSSLAVSEPRLITVIRIRISLGTAFAYSTKDVEITIKDACVEQLVIRIAARPLRRVSSSSPASGKAA
jgi:hypothetical protein